VGKDETEQGGGVSGAVGVKSFSRRGMPKKKQSIIQRATLLFNKGMQERLHRKIQGGRGKPMLEPTNYCWEGKKKKIVVSAIYPRHRALFANPRKKVSVPRSWEKKKGIGRKRQLSRGDALFISYRATLWGRAGRKPRERAFKKEKKSRKKGKRILGGKAANKLGRRNLLSVHV